jgi:hypothetical protein
VVVLLLLGAAFVMWRSAAPSLLEAADAEMSKEEAADSSAPATDSPSGTSDLASVSDSKSRSLQLDSLGAGSGAGEGATGDADVKDAAAVAAVEDEKDAAAEDHVDEREPEREPEPQREPEPPSPPESFTRWAALNIPEVGPPSLIELSANL